MRQRTITSNVYARTNTEMISLYKAIPMQRMYASVAV